MARARLTNMRSLMHDIMANEMLEVMQIWQETAHSFTTKELKEEIIARWIRQEDEVLMGLAQDLAEYYLQCTE
jgi:arginine deiminase